MVIYVVNSKAIVLTSGLVNELREYKEHVRETDMDVIVRIFDHYKRTGGGNVKSCSIVKPSLPVNDPSSDSSIDLDLSGHEKNHYKIIDPNMESTGPNLDFKKNNG